MNIVQALKQEEAKLQKQLGAVRQAITALNGAGTAVAPSSNHRTSSNAAPAKRTMSAALRARLSRKAKERWAKIKAEKAKKAK